MQSKTLLTAALAAALAGAANAESIAFVASFTSTYHTADTIALLQGAGHTVTLVTANTVSGTLTNTHTASGLTRKAYLETFDMVLISRASASGDYTDKLGWAGLEVPVVSMNPYAVRGTDRLHWFSTGASDQGPADPDTIVTVPTHPVWAGVTLTATDTRANLYAPLSGNNVSGGTGTFGTGTRLGTSTGGTNVSTLVVWEDGAQLASGNVAADRRVFFSGGGYGTFLEDGSQTGSNTAPLTADGDIAFLNAIEWALSDDPNPDSDNDGLLDAWELANFRASEAETNEQILAKHDSNDDPDGDTFDNAAELAASSNPNVATSVPGDTDGDSFPDTVEITYFGNLNQTPDGDLDGDFVSNAAEIAAATSPTNAGLWPDTDADLMSDGWETANGLVVGSNDSADHADADGFTNLQEFQAGTDPQDGAWSPVHAKLAHRWSFSGDLLDSVGGSIAQIANDDLVNAGLSSTLGATSLRLLGGAKATSDHVLLGNNLLSTLQAGGVKPVTIELWATQETVSNWSRMWDFGRDVNGDPGPNGSLRMTWSTGTNVNTDQVEWAGNGNSTSSNAPYVPGVAYHVVMTVVPALNSGGAITQGARVTWYTAPVSGSQPAGHPLNVAKGTFNTGADLRSLVDSVCYLGRSMFADGTASATYDEVRIWKGQLTETERELFQLLGADSIDRTDSEPDGFPDAWETARFGNLTTATPGVDSDGDGENDEVEFAAETHPNDILSTGADSDKDNLADAWEMQYFKNLLQIGADDPDGDFNDNEAEETYATNPTNAASSPDTDADGMSDGWELLNFGDLVTADSPLRPTGIDTNQDGDFDTDLQEFQGGFNPIDEYSGRDTDADLLPDYWESVFFQPLLGAAYLAFNGTNDYDNDTATHAEEFRDGTDPTDPGDFNDVNVDGYFDGFSLAATDGFGTTSFNAGTNWPGAVAPVAGKNYLVTGGRTLRTPNVAAQTTVFAGLRLALADSQFWLKGANSIAQAAYVFDGVTVRNAEDVGQPVTLAGSIQTVDPSVLFADNGDIILAANVTGSGGLTLNGNATAIRQVLFNSATNTWNGNLTMNPTASLVVNGVLNPGTGSIYNIAPRAGGVTNSIGGTGTFTLAGTMNIDLTAAAPALGASTWNLLTVVPPYDPGFTVTGSGFTPDAGVVGARIWTSGEYEFDESTGILSYTGTFPGFDAWAASSGLSSGLNDGAEQNPDVDGFNNVLEYQLGGNPLGFDGDLVQTTEDATHLVFTFERFDASELDSTLEFRWSTGLASWNTVPLTPGTDANGVIVTVTEDGGSSADFDLIVVRLPKSNAAGGKLFGQLEGTRP